MGPAGSLCCAVARHMHGTPQPGRAEKAFYRVRPGAVVAHSSGCAGPPCICSYVRDKTELVEAEIELALEEREERGRIANPTAGRS